MGRQEGIIQLTGRVGNLSFYKSQDGYMVRKQSGVSRNRIMSDPAYARTRENIAEFGRASRATKLLRTAFHSLLLSAADNRVTGRLTGAMAKVLKADARNPRGQRNVADGEPALLQGFEFNKHSKLATTLAAPFTASIDRASGAMIVDIPPFTVASMVTAPGEATHFRLKAAGADIDFGHNSFSVSASESADLPISEEMQTPLQLRLSVTPASVHPLFLLLGVEFLQLVNGIHYPLSNGSLNALAIVKVDAGAAPRMSLPKPKEKRVEVPFNQAPPGYVRSVAFAGRGIAVNKVKMRKDLDDPIVKSKVDDEKETTPHNMPKGPPNISATFSHGRNLGLSADQRDCQGMHAGLPCTPDDHVPRRVRKLPFRSAIRASPVHRAPT